jgi:predicted transcriptional regulator
MNMTVVRYVQDAGCPVRVGDIAHETGLRPGAVRTALAEAEAYGFVQHVPGTSGNLWTATGDPDTGTDNAKAAELDAKIRAALR